MWHWRLCCNGNGAEKCATITGINGHILSLGTILNYNKLIINYNLYLNKLLICCLLIVSKVVVTYRVGLRDLKYGHAE